MDYAYQFVIDNHGIDTEDDYPYQGRDRSCKKDKVIVIFSLIHLSITLFFLWFTFNTYEFCLFFSLCFCVASFILF